MPVDSTVVIVSAAQINIGREVGKGNNLNKYMRETYSQDTALGLIQAERNRQDQKWGRGFHGRSDLAWLGILAEEFGEVANAILEHDEKNLITEITQVAAVCVAWLEMGTPSSEQYAQGELLFGDRPIGNQTNQS